METLNDKNITKKSEYGGYTKPIQAYAYAKIKGKMKMYYHFFAEWDTFEEAIKWLKHGHKCPIIINEQSRMGILA